MQKGYRGSLQFDWTDLERVREVAEALNGVIGKRPDRDNYNIYPNVRCALRDGAAVVEEY